jgi:hypothetical protein
MWLLLLPCLYGNNAILTFLKLRFFWDEEQKILETTACLWNSYGCSSIRT